MGGITAPTVALIPFTPQARAISTISNANPAVITTTQNHGYLSQAVVRFFLPPPTYFGMPQLNGQFFEIIVLSPTTFSIPLDTTLLGTFTSGGSLQVPQTISIAENASTLLSAEKNAFVPIGGS